MDTDVIYAVRCITSVLTFPILVHLLYQPTGKLFLLIFLSVKQVPQH